MNSNNNPTAKALLEKKIDVYEEDSLDPARGHTGIITSIDLTFKKDLITIRTEYRLDDPKHSKKPVYSYEELPLLNNENEKVAIEKIDECVLYMDHYEISPLHPRPTFKPIDPDRLINLIHRIGTHCSLKVYKYALIKSLVTPFVLSNPD